MIAYGASSLILALFFNELHVSDARIGLFLTLTLVGDVVLSLAISLVADRFGRRRTVCCGALLMILSGTTFALSENYWVLLPAAVVGVLSATGGDTGPFRAIEESTISELTVPETRSDVLTWYITTASLGSASGTVAAGRLIQWLQDKDGWTLLDAYHVCFGVYALMGFLALLATLSLSPKCELKEPTVPKEEVETSEAAEGLLAGQELSPVDDSHHVISEPKSEPKTNKIAQISKETRSIMYALWFLLMVDSLADGMVSMSLTTYYIDEKYHIPKSQLGDVLSASYLLAACSTIFAGPLARHIGLVNTMVFTHVPSSLAVLLFPLPQNKFLTFALLLLRTGLNNMDQAPRAALIAAVVKPEERTAVMGITSTLRTLANVTGPSFTGLLAENGRFWIAFVVGGALRLAYDLGLFVMFINIQLYKHEPIKEAMSTTAAERVSLDAFELGSDMDEDDLEARLRLSNSSDERVKYDEPVSSSISGQKSSGKPLA
ncbi:hypothetical protein N0V82_010207 [Gnomoniopsis sp. IMI 355080]|nr:hypothetical protein N0V82_010207 [Gnomoniopsis sp. IMI 355080]